MNSPEQKHPEAGALQAVLSPQAMREQIQLIQRVMAEVMEDGVHYGVVPGTNRPTLLDPGAEKLRVLFRLAPAYTVDVIGLPLPGHREYRVSCRLTSIVTGAFVGEGLGSCSTMEKKYRYRAAERKCPQCGKTAIIKGKDEYGGGWLCFKKKDGCGAKFQDGDPQIEGQAAGQVENPDIADLWNTVLKMAKKRASVDATRSATAASDIFSQDLEDHAPENKPVPEKPAAVTPPPQHQEKSAAEVTREVAQEEARKFASWARKRAEVIALDGHYPAETVIAEVKHRAKEKGWNDRDLSCWSLDQIREATAWVNEIAEDSRKARDQKERWEKEQAERQKTVDAPQTGLELATHIAALQKCEPWKSKLPEGETLLSLVKKQAIEVKLDPPAPAEVKDYPPALVKLILGCIERWKREIEDMQEAVA